MSPDQLRQLAEATGPRDDPATARHTRTSLVPPAVLHAFPDRRLAFGRVREMALELVPTAPFGTGP